MSASAAEVVLVNLEDLWLESEPQNVPGTTVQRPNWQRKARYSLETFCEMPQVLDTLGEVNGLRAGAMASRGAKSSRESRLGSAE